MISEIELSIVSGTYNRLPHMQRMVDSVRQSVGVGLIYEIVLYIWCMCFSMAFYAQRNNIQPMLLFISVPVMILVCLLTAPDALLGGYRRKITRSHCYHYFDAGAVLSLMVLAILAKGFFAINSAFFSGSIPFSSCVLLFGIVWLLLASLMHSAGCCLSFWRLGVAPIFCLASLCCSICTLLYKTALFTVYMITIPCRSVFMKCRQQFVGIAARAMFCIHVTLLEEIALQQTAFVVTQKSAEGLVPPSIAESLLRDKLSIAQVWERVNV